MSPKTSTTAIVSLIALLSLTLTVTRSLAEPCPFKTVPELLEYYQLPAGFFPDGVQRFVCPPTGDDDAVLLVMSLNSACTVTSVKFGVNYTVQYEKLVTAVVYTRLLTNMDGVSVKLVAPSESAYGPLDLDLQGALEVKASPPTVQFFAPATGSFSPTLPVSLIPSEPQNCTTVGLQQAALDAHQAEDKKRHANDDNQHGTPNNNYGGGRLLRPAGLFMLNY